MKLKKFTLIISIILSLTIFCSAKNQFVEVREHQFFVDGKPYYFIGTNYWYGSLLGLEKNKKRGIKRLRKELDFLKKNGVNNLRVLGGAEGFGLINNIPRVQPSLQPEQGKFNAQTLVGLDILLNEMSKRNLKAIIFFSNNWEWSGGFQQYLAWNGLMPKDFETRKLDWEEYRDLVSQFYTCKPCKNAYNEQVKLILNRTNSINGKKYTEDATIMAWELANEPRPMRPKSNEAYKNWIAETAALIKSKDKNHLVTLGHEGSIGTESLELFEEIHTDKNVDYLTMHIWAKNWGWLKPDKFAETFPVAMNKADEYINQHIPIAEKLKKPLVIEEFGLPRDKQSFDVNSTTTFRDKYYEMIFSKLAKSAENKSVIAGANFWAFGGISRPIKNQTFWKKGDEYMGDPPMEEQGLNTVFDSDQTTWKVIKKYSKLLK